MQLVDWLSVLIVAAVIVIAAAHFVRRQQPPRPDFTATDTPAGAGASSDLYAALDRLEPRLHQCAHPQDLLDTPEFEAAVEMLCEGDRAATQLLQYVGGDNVPLACVAAEALCRRSHDSDLTDEVLQRLGRSTPWADWFVLRYLETRASRPVAGEVFIKSQELWLQYGAMRDYFNAFLEARRRTEGKPSFAGLLDDCPAERLEQLQPYLESLRPDLTQPLVEQIVEWRRDHVDIDYLRSIGRVWAKTEQAQDIVVHAALGAGVELLERALEQTPPRTTVVVGEPGVGKSVLVRQLCRRMQQQGWQILEATSANVIAGQVYLGELEGRVKRLVDNLGARKRVLWYVPSFHELYFSGRHRYSEAGVLDVLLPYIESGAISIIGESALDAYDRLLQARPQLGAVVDTMRLRAASDQESLSFALEWAAQQVRAGGEAYLAPDLVRECHRLARHHLRDRSAPGNTFRLLRTVLERHRASADDRAVELNDVLATLSRLTGLPGDVLDDRKRLDLGSIRAKFSQRVLGQPEAVECLVERIAMLKAGLTDPERPVGVFLFAGPTGTGKTEIAKALAAFLFGAAERMIRLDMSEFSTEDSVPRLVSSNQQLAGSQSLVSAVRQQPFSVVLLDEFEKAHPSVWDLFLQVFDDGRLTDAGGSSADFRHTIIILTSNLGAAGATRTGIGFTPDKASFSLNAVHETIQQTFRREFLNRLDRIVVFRPLDRSLMRQILHKELKDALGRRGLRNREWAVEWEQSAIEFLLDQGFTADLGARPLRRAIEQHVLAPLAMTIVEHQFPEGDQFLFLRSDGEGVQVEFVDPDGPGSTADETALAAAAGDTETSLRGLVLDPHGSTAELQLLRESFHVLQEHVHEDVWRSRKDDALAMTNSLEFWDSPDRHRVLGDIEFMDRVEAAMQSAGSLLRRIEGNGAKRTTYPGELMRRLAQQLYLVGLACEAFDRREPHDAFVLIEAGKAGGAGRDEGQRLFRATVEMYRKWARKRRMRQRVLGDQEPGATRVMLAVSGFAAYPILAPETGLHVWEIPSTGRDFTRYQVRVRVAAQPDAPMDGKPSQLEQAERAIAELDESKLLVVRRYREQPSPLVRDSTRGWRSGRLDRVLEGDFDVVM